jgi:hypothetical protein
MVVIMSNPPAFPLNTPKWHESVSDAGFQDIDFTMGMTLRDYFAAKSLANEYTQHDGNPDKVAEWAYAVADAMLRVREQ